MVSGSVVWELTGTKLVLIICAIPRYPGLPAAVGMGRHGASGRVLFGGVLHIIWSTT